LLDQIEARYALPALNSVPADAPPEATGFAVPRREWRDVRFAESPGADAREQSLDVYAPATGEGRPFVVWFHGGGMKAGDKAHPGVIVLKPDFFIARGFVFVSANYRLAPRHVHPAQVDDTAAALAWVHDHAAEYGGDPGKVFVIGISAGAHLAAVVATNERFLAAHDKSPAIIAGEVILDIGSFDIPTLMEQAGARAPEMYRYTFRNGGNAEDWKDCSPSYHVRPGKSVPPLLLCYVEGRAHHAQENERFAKLVRESGGEATVLAAARKTHLSIEAEIGTRSDAVTAAILHFVESCHRRTVSRAGVTNEAAGLAARRSRTRPEADKKEGHRETQ
jgi:acetyl esterase/lipase